MYIFMMLWMTFNSTAKKIFILMLKKIHIVFHIKIFAICFSVWFQPYFVQACSFTGILPALTHPWSSAISLLMYVSGYSNSSFRNKTFNTLSGTDVPHFLSLFLLYFTGTYSICFLFVLFSNL